MLRILIFAWRDSKHPDRGGSEEYLHQIAKRLVQKGHQVTFFASMHPGGSLPEEKIDGIRIVRRGNKYTVYLWAVWCFLRRFRAQQFDIIIDQHNAISFFTPLYTSVPVINLVHHLSGDQWFDQAPGMMGRIGYFIEKYLYPLAYKNCHFVAVSEHTKQTMINQLGVSQEQIEVVRPGIASLYKTKAKTNYPSLIYIGRLKKYKKIDQLIRSLLRLKYFFPNLKLHIVGSGDYKNELVKLTNNLGLANNVAFHGYVSDELKSDWLSSAWALVNSSWHEGWGISVIEANACGTIAIGSRNSGLSESIIDGQTGLLVKPGSIYSLSQAIKKILSSSVLRYRLEKNAVRHARKYNWSKSASQFGRVIDQQARFKPESTVFQPLKSKVLKNRPLPKVVVIVPTSNQVKTVKSAIEQLSQQTYPETVVVGLDNYSTDGTYQYLQDKADKVYVGTADSRKINQVINWQKAQYVFLANPDFDYDSQLIADCVYRLERFKRTDAVRVYSIALGQNHLNRFMRIDQQLFSAPPVARFFRRSTWEKRGVDGLKTTESKFYIYTQSQLSLWQYVRRYQEMPADYRITPALPSWSAWLQLVAANPLLGINYTMFKIILKAYLRLAGLNHQRQSVLSPQYE